MIYRDQFTPCYPTTDMSYDDLERADRGTLLEHLAPLGHEYWSESNQSHAIIYRVFVFDKLLESLGLNIN